MRTFFNSLVFLTFTVWKTDAKEACPPTCNPPPDITGCTAYISSDGCAGLKRDMKTSLAECGCLWKNYIQSLVEPDRNIIFTNYGIQCYVWAMTVCAVHVETTTTTTTSKPPALEVDYETGDLFGKLDGDKGKFKSVERVTSKIFSEKDLKRLEEKGVVIKRKNHWSSWNIHDDQFKLAVFGFILLFNVVCVAIAVCCRCDTRTKEKEQHMAGDLEDNKYPDRPARIINFEKFLEKLRLHKARKREEQENSYAILGMQSVGPIDKRQQKLYSTRLSCPQYDSADEQSDLLDTSYEEPLPLAREVHPKHARKSSMSDEDTLYENVQPKNRSVSFKAPQGLSADQTERIPKKSSKKDMIFLPTVKWTR